MTLPADMEPAVRDPRQLRRTAWILVAIMVLGGTLVYKAYDIWAKRQAADTRPAFLNQIRKEHWLRVMRQDGKRHDLFDAQGKVWVVHTLALSNPETSRRAMDVMKRLAEKHPDGVIFVSLVVDQPPPGNLQTTLATHADELGIEAPQWWLAVSDPNDTHKFVKKQLEAGIFPHEENGKWIHDTSIYLIDRTGHLRRAVVPNRKGGAPYIAPFDFDQAAKWDEDGIPTGTGRSNVEELEALLSATIDTLLKETPKTR